MHDEAIPFERLDDDQKEVLLLAMKNSGLYVEGISPVTENKSTIVLTRRESLRLLEMIEDPPPRNKKFHQAQARYRKSKNEI
jgi:hypothetical protein